VEDRLKYIEGGDAPRKNIEVMKEAVEEAETARQAYLASVGGGDGEKKKKKKKKKVKVEEGTEEVAMAEAPVEDVSEEPSSGKKKKKRSLAQEEVTAEPAEAEEQAAPTEGKKRKKKGA